MNKQVAEVVVYAAAFVALVMWMDRQRAAREQERKNTAKSG
jgi:hypothetical protein